MFHSVVAFPLILSIPRRFLKNLTKTFYCLRIVPNTLLRFNHNLSDLMTPQTLLPFFSMGGFVRWWYLQQWTWEEGSFKNVINFYLTKWYFLFHQPNNSIVIIGLFFFTCCFYCMQVRTLTCSVAESPQTFILAVCLGIIQAYLPGWQYPSRTFPVAWEPAVGKTRPAQRQHLFGIIFLD